MGEEQKKTQRDEWTETFPELATEIDAAIAKHGEDDLVVLELARPKGAAAIFRAPTSGEYRRFTTAILDDKASTKAAAAGILARACVVYPDKQTFASWIDRYDGIGSAVLKHLSKLAGAELAERGKE